MKINTGDNKKAFFFYLFLVDFIIAMQIAAVSFLQVKSSDFFLSFVISFLVFLAFSEIFGSSRKIKSIMRPGMIFMILGSLINFFPSDASFFALGRVISGLGAGMVMASQIGMIWHDDSEEIKNFSVVILFSFISGLIFGPALVSFLSGPALGEMKVVFVLGMIIPILIILESNQIVWDVVKSFFGIKEKEGIRKSGRKVASLVAKRIVYVLADYWLAGLCAAANILLKVWGVNLVVSFIAMWAVNIFIAGIFFATYVGTGIDVSLGEDLRRAADKIHEKSKIAGYLSMLVVIFQAIFWSGPEQVVIFFQKEIKGKNRSIMILLFLTAIQTIIWMYIYRTGYDILTN